MDPLDWIGDELERLTASYLLREPTVISSTSGPEIVIDGKPLVLACSNNYLGLAGDYRVVDAAMIAARRWGAGTGASPLVSGLTELQRELEGKLAVLESVEDAIVFSSGYLANVGAIQSLVGQGDAVFSDELNHASIIDGSRLSRARVNVYRHADADHLRSIAARGGYRRGLIVTDSVFSMDGDIAPLAEIAEVAREYGLMTMVDEAHATGVIGPGGAGAVEALGLGDAIDVKVGTLSKALGSAGGFVAGGSRLAVWLRNRARSQVFDTAPAPAALGAAKSALDIVAAEAWRRERIVELRSLVVDDLREAGFEVGSSDSAIIPVMVGESRVALELAAAVREAGVFAPAIRPPSVAEGAARIRLTVMATHSDSQVEQIISAFASARPGRAS